MSRNGAGKGRRGVLIALSSIAVVAGGLVALAPVEAAPAPALDTNLENYVLFARDYINFKGANNGGGNIPSGNIGVNHAGGQLNMCGGVGHKVIMSQTSQAVADYTSIGSECQLGHLFWGGPAHKIGAGAPSVQSTTARVPWTNIVPDSAIANPPATKPCTGDLVVRDGGHLQIWGDQVYCNVRIGQNTVVSIFDYNYFTRALERPRSIWVTGRVSIGNGSEISGWTFANGVTVRSNDVRWYVNSAGVANNDSSWTMGRNTRFNGRIQAPNGQINLGNSTTLVGKFWAKRIISDFAVDVSTPTSTSTTTTRPPTTVTPTTRLTTTTPPPPPTTVPPTPTTTPTTFEP